MPVSPREGYRLWAATYDDAPNPITSLLDRHLKAFVGETRGRRVIDVACGTGRWVGRLEGFGADISGEMLARAPYGFIRGRVAQADARQLPFADSSADVVLCALGLGYIFPVRPAIEEMRRVVRVGGMVIAADLHPSAMAGGFKRTFDYCGQSVEIENYAHSFGDLEVEGLALEESRELYFGEEERAIYKSSGCLDLFERVRRAFPALWMRRWRR